MAIPVKAEFMQGPYDGLTLDVQKIETLVGNDAMRESFDNRLFLLMPRPSDWDRVLEGKADEDGPFDLAHPYEVSAGLGGLKLVYYGIARFGEVMEHPV